MIHVRPDAEGVTDAALRVVKAVLSGRARRGAGPVRLVLSGGRTPQALYRRLSLCGEDEVPWSRLQLFWGDERCVSKTDPRSNYGMVRAAGLLDRPLRGVYAMPGELPPPEGALQYERDLRAVFPDGSPCFDLTILGLGADGHIASLLPGSSDLAATDRWVVATEEYQGTRRLSLTLPVLASSCHVLFLVTGEDKAEAVRAVLGGASAAGGSPSPARALLDLIGARAEAARASAIPRPKVSWLLDEAAAGPPTTLGPSAAAGPSAGAVAVPSLDGVPRRRYGTGVDTSPVKTETHGPRQ